MTNGEINRLGKTLRTELKETKPSTESLKKLQDYRTSYKDSLSFVFNVLQEEGCKVWKTSIVTYRLKRIDSILRKVEREPNMQFSRMWDIGGCRCILKNDTQVYKVAKLIEARFNVRKSNDYVIDPKEDGYKSLHLYVDVPNEKRVIEIQLRNQNDHNWATLVEISDVIFDAGIKEYQRDKRLLRFHYLLSIKKSLSIDEMTEIAEIVIKYKYIEKITSIFSRNTIEVRKQWMEIESTNHKYFLIETSKDQVPIINSYKHFYEAEREYFKRYLNVSNKNIVLTHLPTPNFDQINIAYSNYFLTFHEFNNTFIVLIKSLVKKSLNTENIFKIVKYYHLYNVLALSNILHYLKEVSFLIDQTDSLKRKDSKELKRWEKRIEKEINDYKLKETSFIKTINSSVISSFWKRQVLKVSFKLIERKFSKKLINQGKEYL